VLYQETTIKFDAAVFSLILDLFILEVIEAVKHIPGLFPVLILQPIAQISTVGNKKNGGNPFGFKDDNGPLVGKLLI
jgi:hypothetical protein